MPCARRNKRYPGNTSPTPFSESQMHWRTVPKRLCALVGLAMVAAAAFVYRQHSPSADRLPWQTHRDVRGTRLPAIRMTNGTERSLANGRAHVVYLFATDCAPCTTQRALMARILGAVDSQAVVTASIEDSSTIASYWVDAIDSLTGTALPQPLSIDSSWLRSTNLPIRIPALLFVTPDGRVSQLVTGSVLSWNPNTLRKNLVVAQIRESF